MALRPRCQVLRGLHRRSLHDDRTPRLEPLVRLGPPVDRSQQQLDLGNRDRGPVLHWEMGS